MDSKKKYFNLSIDKKQLFKQIDEFAWENWSIKQ